MIFVKFLHISDLFGFVILAKIKIFRFAILINLFLLLETCLLLSNTATTAAIVPQQSDRLRVECGSFLERPQIDCGKYDTVPGCHMLWLERLANALLEREQPFILVEIVLP